MIGASTFEATPDEYTNLRGRAVDEAIFGLTGGEDIQPLTEYQDRALDFLVEKLGIRRETIYWSLNEAYGEHRWDGHTDPLMKILEAVEAGENVGCESGTGTGKSFLLACLILWFVACFRNARVFTFAPKEDQLELFIWKEIGELWPRFQRLFPRAELTHLRIRMIPGSDAWGAWGRPVGVGADEFSATRARGMHAEHMFLVAEEATGIHAAVMNALRQTCTAPHNFIAAIGNPDHQHDGLHKFCESESVRHVIASSLDHPNVVTGNASVVPGAVSREFLRDRKKDHPPGSRLWEAHVRGRCPMEAKDALIRWEWCERAARKWEGVPREGLPALGVDVARSEDGDMAAWAEGVGPVLEYVDDFRCNDVVALGGKVALKMRAGGISEEHVGVDSAGLGGGTVDKLKELRLFVQALNGGERPIRQIDEDVERDEDEVIVRETVFRNLRAQMWWQMRLDLMHGRIALPPNEDLWRDLTTPTYETRLGKVVVEEKDEIRKELGRSPDLGDAAVMWNWVRFRQEEEEEEEDLSAWDPDVLRAESEEGRKVRNPGIPKRRVDPMVLQEVD